MTVIETVGILGSAGAVLKATPPALDAGKKFFGMFNGKELKQVRQELDDARKALDSAERELQENETVVSNLTDEVVETQAQLVDVQDAFDTYRDEAELVFWVGGSAIVLLLIVVVCMSLRHS